MAMWASRGAVAFVLVVGVAGCGAGPGLPPVNGVVTVDGEPLRLGTVTFYPDAAKGNASGHQPVGLIEGGGRYSLMVPGGKSGAPPGWYKVVVYAVHDPQPGKPNTFLTHRQYADLKTTTLSVEVVANPEPGRYDLKLKK